MCYFKFVNFSEFNEHHDVEKELGRYMRHFEFILIFFYGTSCRKKCWKICDIFNLILSFNLRCKVLRKVLSMIFFVKLKNLAVESCFVVVFFFFFFCFLFVFFSIFEVRWSYFNLGIEF